MKLRKIGQYALLPWLIVGLLTTACVVLAFLQYRWITEFSAAEHERIHGDLQGRLNLLARSLNEEISDAASALIPGTAQSGAPGPEPAYAARYETWRESHAPLFSRIALVAQKGDDVTLLNLDLATGRFSPAPWPVDWATVRERYQARLNRRPLPPLDRNASAILEVGHSSGPGREILVVELNVAYVRDTLFPDLLKRFVGDGGRLDYDTEVVVVDTNESDPVVIYHSGPQPAGSLAASADASVTLLNPQIRSAPPAHPRELHRGPPPQFGGAPGGGRGTGRGYDRGPGPPPRGPQSGPFQADFGPPRWRLSVRHHAGSLDSLVDQARSRNLLVSGGLLLLILASVATLLRLSRQSQRLAELQMNFVAGVSHEFRTPLTVIRTAAFNLRGKMANRPEHVERYGKLIQDESEKLGALVEQVLRFASGQAGHAIREREQVDVGTLIEDSLQSSRAAAEAAGVALETRVDSGLPPVLADKLALRHALQNLVDNALKYGTGGNAWVGIFASAAENPPGIEIRVADHGPGIPPEEQAQIFDPFFRGRRAVSDQVHGTGLGLNLVKKIVEAHGGSIRVSSDPGRGTEFIVRIPVAPSELQNEVAHSLS